MSFTSAMDDIAKAFEALGAAVLVGGVFWSAANSAMTWRATKSGIRSYEILRRTFGGALLLGLEVLVAADLIRTVAVAPTLDNVLVLGIVVLIRTFLSFSLQVEIDGVLPWRKASTRSGTHPAPTTPRDHPPAATRPIGTASGPVANPERHRSEPPPDDPAEP